MQELAKPVPWLEYSPKLLACIKEETSRDYWSQLQKINKTEQANIKPLYFKFTFNTEKNYGCFNKGASTKYYVYVWIGVHLLGIQTKFVMLMWLPMHTNEGCQESFFFGGGGDTANFN